MARKRQRAFAAKVCRYLLLILNFVALICSIGALGVGMNAMWEHQALEYILGSNLFSSSAYILIAVGSLSFVLIAIGCFAAITQFKCLLVIYTVCLLTVVLMSIVGGAMGFVLRRQIGPPIMERMELSLKQFYGHPKETQLTEAWDYMQSTFGCCAVSERTGSNHLLWTQSEWFSRQTRYPKERVPASCCPTCLTIYERYCGDDYTRQNGSLHDRICIASSKMCSYASTEYVNLGLCQGNGDEAPDDWPIEAYMNLEGCFPVFQREMRNYATVIGSASFGLAGILLLAVICAFVLYRLNDTPSYTPTIRS
uniref:Tetraspanin n=1 Tax=Plectus sambesii TaxID=2011161 RepID=A0A914XRD7_9BILA